MVDGGYLGEFEQIVLLALARLEEDAYGVTIRKEIEDRSGRRVAIGALYTTLRRLEDKGLVRSSLAESTPVRGGRSKRYFRLTPRGVRALKRSRAILDRMWRGVGFEPEPL